MKPAKFLIRQYGQDDASQKQKLCERKNLVRSDANGKLFKSRFEIE